MKPPRFAVDFDGTLVEDDHYPAIGEWLPGATEFLHALERIGQVVIWTCRTADAHHVTEEPRGWEHVDAEIEAIRMALSAHGFGHLPIWTKTYKPPAAVYVDNKAVHADGDFDGMLERVLDLLAPIGSTIQEVMEVFPDMKMITDRDPGDETTERASILESIKEAGGISFPCNDPKTKEWVAKVNEAFDKTFPPKVDIDPVEHGVEIMSDESWTPNPPGGYSRHPSSARFHEVLQELGDLHDQKSVGYGTDDDPLANCRASEKWGVPGWQGTMIRASDKVQRLQAYAQKGDLPFEAIEDAFRDLAVYAVIALVLFEQEREAA